jgi:hypothetical protein
VIIFTVIVPVIGFTASGLNRHVCLLDVKVENMLNSELVSATI